MPARIPDGRIGRRRRVDLARRATRDNRFLLAFISGELQRRAVLQAKLKRVVGILRLAGRTLFHNFTRLSILN